ncbi:hypothetical protein M8C21_003411 [Ambrosia artemisiifolia]|uniref:Uncharacterized protein n=1 Tax=Ambrosia artemisiifolia TaxID=4212 RepID=A0AAD5BQI7_AMBAR|nr:hypothetical protein M8C21_003411 [Ambrosia artemisiifolia]
MPTGGRPGTEIRFRPGKEVMPHGESSSSLHIQDPEHVQAEPLIVENAEHVRREPPIFLTHLLERFDLIMVLVLTFAVTMLICIGPSDSKIKQHDSAFIVLSVIFITSCLILSLTLLKVYQRSLVDPGGRPLIKLLNLGFHLSGFLGLVLPVIVIYIPGRVGQGIGYVLVGLALVCLSDNRLVILLGGLAAAHSDGRAAEHDIERPMFLKRFSNTLRYVVTPMICFAISGIVYLEAFAKDKIQLVIVGNLTLVFLSIGISITLGCHYQRSEEDPGTQRSFKFLNRFLYTSSFFAWVWSSSYVLFPGKTGHMISIALGGSCFIFLFIFVLCDANLCPKRVREMYQKVVCPLERPDPIFLTHHLSIFGNVIQPLISFCMGLQIYTFTLLHKVNMKQWLTYKPFLILAGGLDFGCTFLGFALLIIYQRAPIDPNKCVWVKFLKNAFYATGFAACGLTICMASFPKQTALAALLWAIAGAVGLFLVFGTFIDHIKLFAGYVFDFFTSSLASPPTLMWLVNR